MANPPSVAGVKLSPKALKLAEEQLSAEIDAEVLERIRKEKNTMTEADLRAAVDAAQQKAATAAQEAAAAKQEAGGLKAAVDAMAQSVKELAAAVKQAQADRQAAVDADLAVKARRLAGLRAGGRAEKVTDAEVARLKGLGAAAVDEMLAIVSTPGIASPSLELAVPAADDDGISMMPTGNLTVTDWNKVADRSSKKHPMGVPSYAGVA